MFKAFAARGTPVPPELRSQMEAMMQANPTLKEKIEISLRGSAIPTAAQEEANREILRILRENPEAFTQEDLEALTMAADSSSSSAGGPATAEVLRKPSTRGKGRADRRRWRGSGTGGTGSTSGAAGSGSTGSGTLPPTSGEGSGSGSGPAQAVPPPAPLPASPRPAARGWKPPRREGGGSGRRWSAPAKDRR